MRTVTAQSRYAATIPDKHWGFAASKASCVRRNKTQLAPRDSVSPTLTAPRRQA